MKSPQRYSCKHCNEVSVSEILLHRWTRAQNFQKGLLLIDEDYSILG